MDDVYSQMPEVVWDCGSPSPSAWKRCQVAAVSSSSEEQVSARDDRATIKKPLPIFKIDSKKLDKARAIIAQLRTSSKELENTPLELLFERSGNNEDLATAVTSPSAQCQENQTDVNDSLPADFWNDDIFEDLIQKPQNADQATTSVMTSTPMRGKLETTTPKSLKRRHLKRRSKLIPSESTPTKENEKSCPLKILQNGRGAKENKAEDNKRDSLDSCAEFLTTFKPRIEENSQKEIIKDSNYETTKKTPFLALKKIKTDLPTDKNENSSEDHRSKTSSKPKPDSISISDEILSQLVMDDSWTVKCTTGAAPQPPTMQNEISLDKSLLTQMFMDDSWAEDCSVKPAKITSLSSTAVKLPKPSSELIQKTSVSVSNSNFTKSSLEELDKTIRVTPSPSVSKSHFSGTTSRSDCDIHVFRRPKVHQSNASLQVRVSIPNLQNLQNNHVYPSVSTSSTVKTSIVTQNDDHNFRDKFVSSASTQYLSKSSATSACIKTIVSNQNSAGFQNHIRLPVSEASATKPNFQNTSTGYSTTVTSSSLVNPHLQDSVQHSISPPRVKYSFKAKAPSFEHSTYLAPQSCTDKVPTPNCDNSLPSQYSTASLNKASISNPLFPKADKGQFKANLGCNTTLIRPPITHPLQMTVANAFQPPNTSQLTSQTTRRCSAAEIEQKRLQALRRKRQRTKL